MSFLFKKVITIILIFIILILNNVCCFADDSVDDMDVDNIEKVIETLAEVVEFPKINSRYAIVLDRNNKTIIYGKNEKTKTKMASTTNIMTS